MNKINILKKLGVIKYNWTNGLNNEVYYSANKKSILFWVIYILLWIVLFVPIVIYGIFYGIIYTLINEHTNFLHLFDITENPKKK